MTDKPTPTDAELEALLLDKLPASKHYIRPVIEKMVAAMQAAIDKWGQPAQAVDCVLGDANCKWSNDELTAIYNDANGITVKNPPDHYGKSLCSHAPGSTDCTIGETDMNTKQPEALRLAGLLTDEQIKVLMRTRYTAMLMTCKARVPGCGEFSAIAQDLDWLCESLGYQRRLACR